ncbi:phosphonate C-P lyase system protein PhnH [Bacillus mangrovi]|uniref:Phosphonate C-P lyase system protein PhnH n=1 Tax=Metabacillus mangrovi TaxID=1491830 RepID=A0A7X2S509_9BACI|nr:phosphonate C-P lyase system protein PhnH [Metabacillus mangrovi]MTH53512.1 phosphonate C-P lyase system protein PhnH [Metabacillus mangrovi]
MQLDKVHDIQKTYRKLIDTMARPGTMTSIREQAQLAEGYDGKNGALVLLALTLLDPEVTFYVEGDPDGSLSGLMNELTYAKAAPPEEADFIFVLMQAGAAGLERMIQSAKTGTHRNPDQSATILAEAEALGTGEELLLRGPGIDRSRLIAMKLPGSWIQHRAEKNAEYPLGVDFIITDSENLLCLPRTAQITAGEEQ